MNLLHPLRLTLCVVASLTWSTRPVAAQETPVGGGPMVPPAQVMVLGSVHFDNPGQDLHNLKVDDVRTPAKQAELREIADRLAKFAPTKIAVEATTDRPDLAYGKYEIFTPEALTQNADERVQIGFRLARQLGQTVVYGIDEQSDTVDYFPFDRVQAYAKEHGQTALLEAFHTRVEAAMKSLDEAQRTQPLRELLAQVNEPARTLTEHRDFYNALLPLGDAKAQPAADLNGGWYLRNAKIFAKLTQVAKPGDRVLVIFGSGHSYWLRHFVRETPGFVLVEPGEYLR